MDGLADSGGSSTERRRVGASLWAADGARDFVSEIEVAVVDGVVQPVEWAGRRYVFSHSTVAIGYGRDARVELYVFREFVGVDAGRDR